MPLVQPTDPEPRLREMLQEQREGLAQIRQMIAEPPAPVREPLGLLTARDLVEAALAATADDAGAAPAELAASVNLLYETMLAAIDLVKMHCDMPIVPRGRKPSPEELERRRAG